MSSKTIAVYLRISTDKQTIASQETAISNWMAIKSIDEAEVRYFRDEAMSGSLFSRPGLQALLQAIRNGEIKTLITFELSRLSRDYMDFLNIMALCNQHGVSVQIPGEGKIAFDTNQDKLIASIRAFLSAEERKKISERTMAGLENARKNGVKLGRPSGTRTNRGWRKQHSKVMLDEIRLLAAKGLSAKDIVGLLSSRWVLSESTVRRLKRKSHDTIKSL